MISGIKQMSKIIDMNQDNVDTYSIKMKYKPGEIVGIPLPAKMTHYRFYIDISHTVAEFRSKILDVDIRDVEYIRKY